MRRGTSVRRWTLTTAVILVACSDGMAPTPRIIEIGAIVDFNGDLMSDGVLYQAALEVAEARANAEYAAQGIIFDIDFRDGQTDPTTSLQALNSLLLEDRRIILGPQASSSVLATQDRIQKSFSLLISPSSTSTELSVPDDHVYRFSPTDAVLVEELVERMWNRGHRSLAMVYRNDSWGNSVSNALETEFVARGGTIIARYSYLATWPSLFNAILGDVETRIGAATWADSSEVAVSVMTFEEGSTLLEIARDSFPSLAGFRWYGSDGFANDHNAVETPAIAEFVISTRLEAPIYGFTVPAEMEEIRTEIEARAGRPANSYALVMYDAFQVAAQTLANLPEEAGYEALESEFLRVVEGFSGFSGPIVLDAAGDRVASTYEFLTIQRSGSTYSWAPSGS